MVNHTTSQLPSMNVSRPDVCGLRTADVINDLAMFIDMVAVLIPSRFLLLICVSSVLKAMSVPYLASPVEFCVLLRKFHPLRRHRLVLQGFVAPPQKFPAPITSSVSDPRKRRR